MRSQDLAALAIAVVVAQGAPAVAASSLAARPAPPAYRSVDDGGGRILVGPLGQTRDSADAFRANLRRGSAYFRGSMQLAAVVRSSDGTTTMGLFRASLGGTPVAGVAIATADAGGAGIGAILFDTATRFPRSADRLAARLRSLPTPGGAPGAPTGTVQDAVARVRTHPVSASDGTVSAQIPDGWSVARLGEGALIAMGPYGAQVADGFNVSLIDPENPQGANTLAAQRQFGGSMGFGMPYSNDGARVYTEIGQMFARAAGKPPVAYHVESTHLVQTRTQMGITMHDVEVVGTQEGGGLPPSRFDCIMTMGPEGPTGLWNVTVRGMIAPTAHYAELGPQMLAIVAGYRYDSDARSAQVEHDAEVGRAITAKGWADVRAGIAANEQIGAMNQARTDASMANARAVQDRIDRSTAGFVHYLGDTDVVRDLSTGRSGVVSQSTSDALTRFDPQHYQSVPVSQYRRGVDY